MQQHNWSSPEHLLYYVLTMTLHVSKKAVWIDFLFLSLFARDTVAIFFIDQLFKWVLFAFLTRHLHYQPWQDMGEASAGCQSDCYH
jgi:hypothetical protein